MKGSPFLDLAETLERVKGTSSKKAKADALSAYLRSLAPHEALFAARLASGKTSARGSEDEAQVGYSTIIGVVEEVCGIRWQELSGSYLRHGDLGEVVQEVLDRKEETALFSEPLTLSDLEDAFARMRASKGKGSSVARRGLVKSLFIRATPLEGKYIAKALTGEMRTGAVLGILQDAIAGAFGAGSEDVARAHMLLGDIGLVAEAASERRLKRVSIQQFRPVNFMLAEPLATPGEVASHFGKAAYAEFKYDGIRAQVHKKGAEVRVYSRRLEDITKSFPELSRAAAGIGHDFIVDGEAVPFRDGRPLSFQLLQRRLRRMEGFEEAAGRAPVEYFAFDILLLDGRELYESPLSERSAKLAQTVEGSRIRLAERATVRYEREVAALFRRSRSLGYEGLVVKDPDSTYGMGRRGAGWVKLKEELDTLDAVIVAAEYGHGKRAGVISDYTFAVWDGDELKPVGKAYSGLTDEEIGVMTKKLKEITVEDHGYRRTVKPEVVVEVAFDSIQKSDRHSSGYALRFPRIKAIRTDKSASDADTVARVEEIYRGQAVRAEDA